MTRLIAAAASLLLLSAVPGAPTVFASAAHTEFEGIVFLTNPCNGEFVTGTGPNRIVYVENADASHFVVHLTFHVKGAVGDQGNAYNMSFVANAQFTAPSGGFDNVTFFDVPVHGQVIAKGKAPNFDFDLGIRVFVVDGTATGSSFIGPSTTTCHG